MSCQVFSGIPNRAKEWWTRPTVRCSSVPDPANRPSSGPKAHRSSSIAWNRSGISDCSILALNTVSYSYQVAGQASGRTLSTVASGSPSARTGSMRRTFVVLLWVLAGLEPSDRSSAVHDVYKQPRPTPGLGRDALPAGADKSDCVSLVVPLR